MTCKECARLEAMDEDVRFDAALDGDEPTNWWHCQKCGRHLDRWKGMGDVICNCGAQYNSGGQRLRDDWSPYVDDDELGDMEQYELSQLRREGL